MENLSQGRLISASSAECADIRYGSGFNAPDEFVYVEHDGKKYAILSILELERGRRQCAPDVTVLNRNDILRHGGKDPRTAEFFQALSEYFGVKHWIVPERFPLIYADRMRDHGLRVSVEKGEFFPQRALKTPAEIEKIAESMNATQDAMYMVRDFLKASSVNINGILEWNGKVLTCDFIRSEVEAEFKRKGYTASETIICCGPDGSVPHNIGTGPVYAGQPLVADIFPRNDRTGYWGDMTRTFVKGHAQPIVQKAFAAVRTASENALAHLHAGVPGILVHQIAEKTMEEAGFHTGRNADGQPIGFIHGLGHGVGLDIHENPRVSPANTKALEAGSVVSIEPGLYDPAWGGIRLEDLVVVTETGYRNFCTMPKELEVE